METEEQQPPPPPPAAAAADKQEEETDEKKKTSEEDESKQDAQPMDAQQEVKQVSIHHTHFAFCVSRNVMCYCNVGVACYKVARLVLCGKYFTSSTVSVHCVHFTQYVHPFYLLFVFCPLDLVIYASMVPAYHLMSTVSVHPLFLYCVHCLVSVNYMSAPHVGVAFFLI